MKKIDKARNLILKGIALHLKGVPLKKINTYYNLNFEKYSFKEKDISFVNYFTSISVRNRGIIEFILKKYIRKKFPKSGNEVKAGIIFGVSQILFSKVPTYASVNSTVNLFVGKIQKWRNFANAVLRKIIEDEIKIRSAIKNNLYYTVPEWLYLDWKRQFGEYNTHKLLKIYQEEPCLDIRVKNRLNFWVKELNGIRVGKSTVRINHKGKIEDLKGFKEGQWWVQDIASQIPVILMGNIKNKIILDLCASPGGKTAQMLNEGALVKAVDISKNRVKKLKKNIERIKLFKNLEIEVCDLMKFKSNLKFDFVLLDAPCTGTGTFRKNPDVVWIKNKNDVIRNSEAQKKFLLKALSYLKKEGTLIYSNCSLQYEEGENIISELCNSKEIYIDKIL
ncbi:MAG: Ribosomal RNA small subunit methyltransferase B, partial [Alphaproteobacteria bacterium MarineAlpha9_Bin4]